MKVLELFGGYGSQALALENLGLDFTSDLCEIDKYAIMAYNQLHGETHNWGDICKIDETQLPYYDLITYSSPCQDFSVAGKQAGGDKGSGTRSSLLWECERIIRAVKPKYLLMENVKNLVGKKHIHNFIAWLKTLESLGYQNFWKVLNAKDYGVPQNRERVFVVSILGGGQYQFPDPIPLTKRLKDVLEQNVDEKYYLSDEIVKRFIKSTENQKYPFGKEYKVLGSTSEKFEEDTTKSRQWVIGANGVSPTLDATMYKTPKQILEPLHIKENTQKGYAYAYDGDSVNLEQPNSQTRRGRVGHQMANTLTCSCNQGVVEPRIIQEDINLYPNSGNPQAGRVYNSQGISPAMDTCSGGNRMPKITEMYNPYNKTEIKDIAPTQTTWSGYTSQSSSVLIKYDNFRIRKLTPRECWRLMGVRDEQFDKLHDISNSQLYKMAGNSIVVDVLMGIFKNMFMPVEQEQKGQMDLL